MFFCSKHVFFYLLMLGRIFFKKKFRGRSVVPRGGTKKRVCYIFRMFFELDMRRYNCAVAFGRIAQIRIVVVLSYIYNSSKSTRLYFGISPKKKDVSFFEEKQKIVP